MAWAILTTLLSFHASQEDSTTAGRKGLPKSSRRTAACSPPSCFLTQPTTSPDAFPGWGCSDQTAKCAARLRVLPNAAKASASAAARSAHPISSSAARSATSRALRMAVERLWCHKRQQAQTKRRCLRSLTWPRNGTQLSAASGQFNHSASVMRLLLARQEVDEPATPDVRTWMAAMIEDARVLAPRFFKCVGQH